MSFPNAGRRGHDDPHDVAAHVEHLLVHSVGASILPARPDDVLARAVEIHSVPSEKDGMSPAKSDEASREA